MWFVLVVNARMNVQMQIKMDMQIQRFNLSLFIIKLTLLFGNMLECLSLSWYFFRIGGWNSLLLLFD